LPGTWKNGALDLENPALGEIKKKNRTFLVVDVDSSSAKKK
jgi:hypothetical protein